MTKKQTHTDTLNMRISEYLMSGLDALASSRGLNRTEYIRFLIQREIETEKNK